MPRRKKGSDLIAEAQTRINTTPAPAKRAAKRVAKRATGMMGLVDNDITSDIMTPRDTSALARRVRQAYESQPSKPSTLRVEPTRPVNRERLRFNSTSSSWEGAGRSVPARSPTPTPTTPPRTSQALPRAATRLPRGRGVAGMVQNTAMSFALGLGMGSPEAIRVEMDRRRRETKEPRKR